MIFHAGKTRSLPLFPDASNNGTQQIIHLPIIRIELTILPTHMSALPIVDSAISLNADGVAGSLTCFVMP